MPCPALRRLSAATTLVIFLAHPRGTASQSQVAVPLTGQYRPPSIAIVQPPEGGTVAHDRPVVVFRFLPGDPADQLDLGSLRVTVNGRDVTTLFRTTPNESWGPLAAAAAPVASGPHTVVGRICSLRGACGSVTATVSVSAPAPTATDAAPASGRKGFIPALVRLTRRIIGV